MTQTVLILGGRGKIGSHSAKAFAAAGWTVRHFNRKTDDMTTAAQGVDVIVNGLNPPNYHNWAGIIPAITEQVITAAKSSGATVILPGNIYNYGDRPGKLGTNTPQATTTHKGRIRIEMEARYRASGVQTIVLRAGNFIDPLGNGDLMSLVMMKDAKKGRITTIGNPNVRQAYAFVPDWARAAVALATMREELDTFVDLPFPGHTFTTAELRDLVSAATGRTFKLQRFPWWVMAVSAPVWELARELKEMRYQFDMDHWIDDAPFKALLPQFEATPLATVLSNILAPKIDPNQTVGSGGKAALPQ